MCLFLTSLTTKLLRSTVDRWLDSLEEAFGGIQAAVLWSGYTNMGVDNRDQFELMRSLPGGTAALRRVVDAMHARGVKALLPCAQPTACLPRILRDRCCCCR